MLPRVLRLLPPLCIAIAVAVASLPASAQSGDPNAADKAKQQSSDPKKDALRRPDEIAEASKQIAGPAGNPECIWLGQRMVVRLWNDDLDTAFRHLDLYDRFGCPGGHVQAAFRCVLRQPQADTKNHDQKAQETANAKMQARLQERVNACWINPAAPPAPAAAANPAPPAGTTTQ